MGRPSFGPMKARSVRVSITLGMLLSSLTLTHAGAARANHAVYNVDCNEGQYGNYLESGTFSANVQYRGVYAQIETKNPELCDPETTTRSASAAWVMVTSRYAPDQEKDGWAQVGYIQTGSGGCYDTGGCGDAKIRFFSQYTLRCKSTLAGCGGGFRTKTVFGNVAAAESMNNYAVRPGSGPYWLYMMANGVVLDTIDTTQGNENGYNPFQQGQWPTTSWVPQWAVETRHPQTDTPGWEKCCGLENADYTDFNTIRWLDSAGFEHIPTQSLTWNNSTVAEYKYNQDPAKLSEVKMWTHPRHIPPP
jgi:hypothetical protein